MKRRRLLATLTAALAGCGGYADTGDGGSGGDLSSEGDDDAPIDASVPDLLLTADALGDGWERRETDEENCRELTRDQDTGIDRIVVTSCAWVHDDAETAREEYDTRVERTTKLSDGSRTDEDPDVGVEAAAIWDGLVVEVVFRDANAVGYLEHRAVVDGLISDADVPPRGDAFDRAAIMHRGWRE